MKWNEEADNITSVEIPFIAPKDWKQDKEAIGTTITLVRK